MRSDQRTPSPKLGEGSGRTQVRPSPHLPRHVGDQGVQGSEQVVDRVGQGELGRGALLERSGGCAAGCGVDDGHRCQDAGCLGLRLDDAVGSCEGDVDVDRAVERGRSEGADGVVTCGLLLAQPRRGLARRTPLDGSAKLLPQVPGLHPLAGAAFLIHRTAAGMTRTVAK